MSHNDIDQALRDHADRLQEIYDNRTAGDHTFTGVLASFAQVLLREQQEILHGVHHAKTPEEMVAHCTEHRTLSVHHQWTSGQRAEYGLLNVEGRRLYDNLRTQFLLDHHQALQIAHLYT